MQDAGGEGSLTPGNLYYMGGQGVQGGVGGKRSKNKDNKHESNGHQA